jgi:hypothetical protein
MQRFKQNQNQSNYHQWEWTQARFQGRIRSINQVTFISPFAWLWTLRNEATYAQSH